MKIILANIEDAVQILTLQKLAYQREADIYQNFSIPPLVQTIDNIRGEFEDQILCYKPFKEQVINKSLSLVL